MATDDNAAYVDLGKQNVSFIDPQFLRVQTGFEA